MKRTFNDVNRMHSYNVGLTGYLNGKEDRWEPQFDVKDGPVEDMMCELLQALCTTLEDYHYDKFWIEYVEEDEYDGYNPETDEFDEDDE